jgi:hypothetical protein
MMAAIPPACCAGADDDEIRTQPDRIGSPHGRDLACAGSGTYHSGIRAVAVANADVFAVAEPLAVTDSVAFCEPDANSVALCESNANANTDRRRVQRRIDRRSRQPALQPDDHQPIAAMTSGGNYYQ